MAQAGSFSALLRSGWARALARRYGLLLAAVIVAGPLKLVVLHAGLSWIDRLVLAPLQEEALKLLLVCGLVEAFGRAHVSLATRATQLGAIAVLGAMFALFEHWTTYPAEGSLFILLRVSNHIAYPLSGMLAHREPGGTSLWFATAAVVHATFNALPNVATQATFGAALTIWLTLLLLTRPAWFTPARPSLPTLRQTP